MTVDLRRFDMKQSNKTENKELLKPYIIFIGVMNNAKDGIDILIDAFATIAFDYPELFLYLFGFYHYDTPGHLKQINELGLGNRIFYKGEVGRDEIPGILINAELLALPRPDSKQAQGGFPTKLGEYLAIGKPVCVTKVGEIPDYLEDEVSAFMAEPGSVDSFADAMRRTLSDPELAKKVGANGRKIAEQHFNMDIQAVRLYSFLLENIKQEQNV
jgi:glycosyltransferase involved in cell wall biosynthesis